MPEKTNAIEIWATKAVKTVVVVGCLVIIVLTFLFTPSTRRIDKDVSTTTDQQVTVSTPIRKPIHKKVILTDKQPVRIEIPDLCDYNFDYGHAPIEARTNNHPEWTNVTDFHVDITSGPVEWIEFRFRSDVEGTAPIICTFTWNNQSTTNQKYVRSLNM